MGLPSRTAALRFFCGVVCALSLASTAAAQSTDVGQPTPVFSGDISGRIAPRDLGDARLTRHFYGFAATEGDLVVTVESTDLNGDVDVFTAGTLRPLLKITLYAIGSTPSRVTKSIYIRRDEALVLRVEGRTVIDTDAQYRIRLTGTFKPAAGAPALSAESQPPETIETATTSSKGRRTTSTGARIPRPVEETPAQPETSAPEPVADEAAREPARRPTGRRSTSRSASRAGSRRTRPPARETAEDASPEAPKPADDAGAEAGKMPEERGAAETPAAPEAPAPRASRTRPPRRGSTRRGAGRAAAARADREATEGAAAPSAAGAAAEPGTRLVIMLKDGELFARDMSAVRRVTVERGQIVVVETNGRVTRHPLANVQRMAIEP